MEVAFIFPGQGSQKVGMGKDFFDNFSEAKEIIENVSDELKIDLKHILFEENDLINQTKYTQVAILVNSIIINTIFNKQIDIKPKYVLGHSLGEFSALVTAGAVDYKKGAKLVNIRGSLMEEACLDIDAGMMVLLGLDDKVVEDIVKDKENVWPANYNSDGQIVLAGKKDTLESLVDTCKSAGAKRAMVLNMSVASHCPLLDTITDKFSSYLQEYLEDNFKYSVVSNVTAKEYNTKDEALKLLKQQLVKPVLYKQSISYIDNKVDCYIEFGSNVLKGINRKITKKPTYSISKIAELEKVVEELKG